jgi:hypothetical protein
VYDDGGRAAAGFKISRDKGACACRAIAIATGKPYREVYGGFNGFSVRAGTYSAELAPTPAYPSGWRYTVEQSTPEPVGLA